MIIAKTSCQECVHGKVCSLKEEFEQYQNEVDMVFPKDDLLDYIEVHMVCRHYMIHDSHIKKGNL